MFFGDVYGGEKNCVVKYVKRLYDIQVLHQKRYRCVACAAEYMKTVVKAFQ